jgi:hypothetical protein
MPRSWEDGVQLPGGAVFVPPLVVDAFSRFIVAGGSRGRWVDDLRIISLQGALSPAASRRFPTTSNEAEACSVLVIVDVSWLE